MIHPEHLLLTVVQFDDEGVVDLHQDVSLHLCPDPVTHWTHTHTEAESGNHK